MIVRRTILATMMLVQWSIGLFANADNGKECDAIFAGMEIIQLH